MGDFTLQSLEQVNFMKVPVRELVLLKNAISRDIATAQGERKVRLMRLERRITDLLFGGISEHR